MTHDSHGVLVVHIARHNQPILNVVALVAFTAGFAFFCWFLVPPLFRRPFSTSSLYVLPFLAFVFVWYVVGLRIAGWRAFGVEQIVLDGRVLRWTRTALWWKRMAEIPTADITEVKAVTPWHALSNRVEFTACRRTQTVGDMLLRDETNDLAEQLRRALGLR